MNTSDHLDHQMTILALGRFRVRIFQQKNKGGQANCQIWGFEWNGRNEKEVPFGTPRDTGVQRSVVQPLR
jgi:hypothetical protein